MYTILIVDAGMGAVAAAVERLAARGYGVVSADDGFEALHVLRSTPVDLVLMELRLPGLDGHHTCFEIKHDPLLRDIPVVIVTAERDTVQLLKAQLVGAEAVIPKPVNWEALELQVEALLGTRVSPAA